MTRAGLLLCCLPLAASCGKHPTLSPEGDGPTQGESPPSGPGDDAGSPSSNTRGDAGLVGIGSDAGSPLSGPTRFISRLVSFQVGSGAGYGQSRLAPGGHLYGPPHGAGSHQGSLDVTSLGNAGSIVVELGDYVVDGPGPDFIVFENPFWVDDNPETPFAEPAQVSVSEDGTNWYDFPCTSMTFPYGQCAGWHPVYSNPDNGISPFDVDAAGGEPFDLADIGVARVKFVKIVDMNARMGFPPSMGFDIDSIAIVNPESLSERR